MPLFELALLPCLIVDLQRDLLLLTHFIRQVVRTGSDAALRDFIQHLQLVQEFALVANQSFLLVELLPQFGELEIVGVLFVLERGLQVALLVFLHLDHALLSVYLHSQQFSLVVEGNLLLAQLVEGLEKGLHARLARLSQR